MHISVLLGFNYDSMRAVIIQQDAYWWLMALYKALLP
jgi:hypothetical protein